MSRVGFGSNAPIREESYALGDKITSELMEIMRKKYSIVKPDSDENNERTLWSINAGRLREALRELVWIHDAANW